MEKSEFNIKNVFKLFAFRRKFILTGILSGILFLLVLSFLLPHKYSASASIMPPSSGKSSGGLSGFLQSLSGNIPLGSFGESSESAIYAEVLRSRSAADIVINKTGIDSVFKVDHRQQLYEILNEALEISVEKSGVINIYVEFVTEMLPDENNIQITKDLVTNVTNAYLAALDEIIRKQNTTGAKQSTKYINRELKDYKRRLDSIELEIVQFQQNNNVLELTEQTQAIAQQGLDLAKELAVAEMEFKIAKRQFAESSPQLKAYKQKYNILSEQYERIQTGGLIPTDKFSLSVDEIPTLIRQYTDLMRNREIMEQVMLYLQTQYYQDAIEQQKDVPVVDILDSAVEPYQRTAPSRGILMIIGTFVITVLILFLVILQAVFKGNLYLNKYA